MKRYLRKTSYSLVKDRISCCLLFAVLLVLLVLSDMVRADRSPYDWAFIQLDYARKEKVQQLQLFCQRIHDLAASAREDEMMIRFFDVSLKCFSLAQEGTPPQKFTRKTAEFHKTFNEYYVKNWLAFYNILFIDKRGHIFYTVRRDLDFERNLFEGDLSCTPLAQCLRKNPQEETFIDFHYYAASDEHAAFFVEPVHKDGQHVGWIVLQFAINKINSLFAGAEKLGETGEAIVVNHDGYMLTESNFEGDSTILKKRLDNRNVETKFREKKGHRIVTDYRGFTAMTSFEVVEFMGTQWLVVVKVDEAQVTTEHFMQHRNYYDERIVQYLAQTQAGENEDAYPSTDRKIIRQVDMDE
ncbi:MAG: cache domain-containing protein, partial [Phycisphaerales bacterium]